jgi:hypothetical protein
MKKCKCTGKCFGACAEKLSPAEINAKQAKECRPCIDGNTKEHDTVTSSITGKKHEISLGPNADGLVPANPFASLAQAGYLHSHPEKLGKAGLKEWDAATKGKKLPKRVSTK